MHGETLGSRTVTCTTFRVLGSVEVLYDGVPLPTPPPRHRAVLAALLVDAGRTVPLDVLVDRAWHERPPGAESATVHATVSKLRRALEPDVRDGAWQVLRTQAPGYRLAVDPDDVDASRFTHLLRRARELDAADRVQEARDTVGAALALWRGPAYADVSAPFAVAEAERLAELRLSALELAAGLDLRLGCHHDVVDHLRALVREAPLREGLRGSLMTALFRCGRQAEALQVYEEGRVLLADELGVDPGPELQRLHGRVLRQDPGLAAPDPAGSGAVEQPPAAPPALPVPLTGFVGRADELTALGAAVAAQRLVTLVGPGGSGKTRLALEAARHRLPDGLPPVLVELAGVGDPGLVAAEVAGALGVGVSGGDPVGALGAALEQRRLLLLLDNCEHVLEAAADLCLALLTRCPGLRVLATSRRPLGVPGEAVVPCGPMSTDTADGDAVRLFLDRARLAGAPVAEPSPTELALVRQVCGELDGLPLAVELAAACLATLPLGEVAARVRDRFALLSAGSRHAPAHQRTLAATVQWSVDLLAPAELTVFAACSVFAGGFAPDAVEAVAGPDVPGGTIGPLRALVAASLVELDHGRARYRMLETLRQYADGDLDAGTRRRLRDRHAEFLADLTEAIEPTLRTRDAAPGWARLDADQHNVRAALEHCLDTGRTTTALRIAGSVGWWWYRRGHVQEGRRWLAAALDADTGAPAAVRVRALIGDALLAYLAGDVPAIGARTGEVVAIAPEDDGHLALALVLRGFVRALLGEPDAADQIALDTARGIAVAERSGLGWVRAELAMTLGQFARAAGDRDGALEHLARAEQIAEDLGHSWAWSSVQWVRAKVLVDMGHGDLALAALSKMVERTVREGDTTGTLAGLLAAVGAAAATGRARDAVVLLGAVQSLSRRVGYDPLRMDPVDGQRYVEAARGALAPGEHAPATAEGAALDLAGACAHVHELAARPVTRTSAMPAPRDPADPVRPRSSAPVRP